MAGNTLRQIVRDFEKGSVKVGFQRGDTHRTEGETVTVATIAEYNEFGTSKIPARPFFRPTMFENRSAILASLARISSRSLRNPRYNAKEGLETLGVWTVNKIRAKIVSVRSPVNATSTILKKRSSNPLIDTGQMRQAVKSKYVPN